MNEILSEFYNMFLFGSQKSIIWFAINYSLFLYISMFILTIIHEFGHYIVAKFQKRKNLKVVIGKGPSIKIGEWTIGLIISEGKTYYYGKLDSILLVLAGTIICLILHFILLFVKNEYVMLFNILNLINIFGNIAPISFLNNDGYVTALMLSEKLNKAKL